MTKFTDLNLDPKVLKAISEAGYDTPTPIQAEAIPHALEGRDVLGIAQTGTGKTASFTLPMITLLRKGRARARMPRSLVLAPTRELAAQVAENFDIYAKHTKLTKALLIGGVSFKEQDLLIDKGVDVLIATPGRLLDHFERGKLILTDVKVMVVDEADRMLDMGFIPDIEKIFQLTPFTRQTLFFSATMAPEIERITNTFLSNPARVEVARQSTTSETITQGLVQFKPSRRDRATAFAEKRDLLRALIEREGDACRNAIIFCNRKMDVDVVAKSLIKHGYNAAPIHGDLEQSQRTRTLDGFRDGSLRFLVASDVAARGLDIPNVSHVFNFDVPSHSEDYVHRIGRTGRAGRPGTTLMLAVPADDKLLAAIEELVKMEIPRIEAPDMSTETSERPRPKTDDETPDAPKRARRSRARTRPEKAKVEAEEVATDVADTAAVDVMAGADTDTDTEMAQETAVEATEAEEAPIPDAVLPAANTTQAPRRDRKGRGRNRDNGPKLVGLGDHVPDFLLRSFAERYEG